MSGSDIKADWSGILNPGENMFSGIEELMYYKNSRIFIKRDDKIPYCYGGNKVRIAYEIFTDMREKGCDAVISYGSPDSNLNRVIACMARDCGIYCRLISSFDDKEYESRMNMYFTRLCLGEEAAKAKYGIHANEALADSYGAFRTACRRNEVSKTVEHTLMQLKKRGYKPYYVYGSSEGKGNERVLERAYNKAFDEIAEYTDKTGIGFDAVFLAYGTGGSFRGLAAGRDRKGYGCGIYGISIARKESLADDSGRIYISDDYLEGGYGGCADEKARHELILKMYDEYGIPLDPVYTAKAFAGMLGEIDRGKISGNVLFIHTGGYPIFDDYIKAASLY